MNLYGPGVRGLMQEKTMSHFFDCEHNGSTDNIYVKIIDHYDTNDKEKRESFWIGTLQTMHP